jgi:hypothetical protein
MLGWDARNIWLGGIWRVECGDIYGRADLVADIFFHRWESLLEISKFHGTLD